MRQSLILVQRCVSIKTSYAAIRNNLVDTTQTALSENSLFAKLAFDNWQRQIFAFALFLRNSREARISLFSVNTSTVKRPFDFCFLCLFFFTLFLSWGSVYCLTFNLALKWKCWKKSQRYFCANPVRYTRKEIPVHTVVGIKGFYKTENFLKEFIRRRREFVKLFLALKFHTWCFYTWWFGIKDFTDQGCRFSFTSVFDFHFRLLYLTIFFVMIFSVHKSSTKLQ